MKKILCLIACILNVSSGLSAQTAAQLNMDSLRNQLPVITNDTLRAQVLLRMGIAYMFTKPDSAEIYLKAGGTLSDQIGFIPGVIRYLSMQASIVLHKNDIDEAIRLDMKALELAKQINSKKNIANAYCNLGAAYEAKDDLVNALKYTLEAVKVMEEISNGTDLIQAYASLNQIYNRMHQPDKGYEMGVKGVALCKALNNKFVLDQALYLVAESLHDLGRKNEAIKTYLEALQVARSIEDDQEILNIISALALISRENGSYLELKNYSEQLLKIANRMESHDEIAQAYLNIGVYHFYSRDYVQARDFAGKSLQVSEKYKVTELIKEGHDLLSQISLAQGNLDSFNHEALLAQHVFDTALDLRINKAAQELDARYSLSKKQMQIDSLNRTKQIQQLQLSHHRIIVWSLVIAIFVLICIGLQYYRNISQKRNLLAAESALNRQRIQQLEKEKQLAAAEAVLQGQDEERTRLAKDLHDGLGGMLSGIKFSFDHMKENLVMTPENQQSFARSMDMLDTSIKELRRVAHNMMPESLLKFGLNASLEDMCSYAASSGQSAVKYQGFGLKDAAIDRNVAVNIYRIIQELLNNAMKHAQAANILVQVLLRDNQFSITVEDDGKGFDKEKAGASGGIGWSNIHNRVAYLNGKMEVESSANKGTSVSISINAAHS